MNKIILAAALAFSFATSAGAAVTPAPVNNSSGLIIKVAEGCGRGFWRGPHGACHPMAMGRACPVGYHLGPDRNRCWPN